MQYINSVFELIHVRYCLFVLFPLDVNRNLIDLNCGLFVCLFVFSSGMFKCLNTFYYLVLTAKVASNKNGKRKLICCTMFFVNSWQ